MKNEPTKIRLLTEIGAFLPGEEHDVDETNPFFLREKCERYVERGSAEWVDEVKEAKEAAKEEAREAREEAKAAKEEAKEESEEDKRSHHKKPEEPKRSHHKKGEY